MSVTSFSKADGVNNKPSKAAGPRPVTIRSVVIGTLLTPLIAYWIAYTQIRANSTDLVMMSLMTAAFFPLICLILINAGLKAWRPLWMLSRGEILTIYVMLTSTVGLSGAGFVPFLAANLPAPYRYATPTNGWNRWHHLLQPWSTVSDPVAVKSFYEGRSNILTQQNFHAWMLPMIAWSIFLLALLYFGYCVAAILRRPWMDSEKLPFPIARIPLDITSNATPLWKNRLFWIGVAIPAVIESVNSVHFTFMPSLPFIPIKPSSSLRIDLLLTTPPWNSIGYMPLAFYPFAIGLAFLIPVETSFSCVFFYFMVKLEQVAGTQWGIRDAASPQESTQFPNSMAQAAGAYVALGILYLYTSRAHLANCFKKAFSRRNLSSSSENEAMSPRAAVLGWLISGAVLVFFGMALGMSARVAIYFFVVYLLFLITFMRIRAEAGLPWMIIGHWDVHGVVLEITGTSHFSAQDTASLGQLEWFDFDWRSQMNINNFDGLYIGRSVGVNLRGTTLAIFIATVVALASAWFSCLHIFYTYGATTAAVNTWYADPMGRLPYDILDGRLLHPMATQSARVIGMAAGAVAVIFLNIMRARFFWWPFSGLGYLIANCAVMDWLWCTTLIGWASKAAIMRYGGLKLYQTTLPFFLGLIVGDIVISAIWTLVFLAFNIPGYRTFPI